MQISQSRFHQIIKNRLFLKSTRKGLLKNVQDGISRPLGSREIQKTKVETVLWDTLYFHVTHSVLGPGELSQSLVRGNYLTSGVPVRPTILMPPTSSPWSRLSAS